jgi:hypothetical protein
MERNVDQLNTKIFNQAVVGHDGLHWTSNTVVIDTARASSVFVLKIK